MTRAPSDNRRPPRALRTPLAGFLLALVLFLPVTSDGTEPLMRVLPNGMTLILQENRTAPVVSMQVWVKTGSARETPAEFGIAHVVEHMVFKGSETRGVGVIAREVEAAGGEINAYTSWDTTVYYIDMASRFMDKGIDILADLVGSPVFDSEELAREIQVVLEEVRRGKDRPTRRISEAFFQEAYTVHPYGRPVIGFEETVRAFSREDVVAFHRKWYVPENMVWVMTGDLDAQEVFPRLEARLSKLPNRPPAVQAQTVEPPQTGPRMKVMAEDVQESHLRIGFPVPGIAHPDTPALDVLAAILGDGKSSRLHRTFRMNRRLVNAVFAYAMTPQDPGLFIVGAQLETKEVEQALPEILQAVLDSGFDPILPEEFKTAKAKIESDFIYRLETVEGQARQLGTYAVTVGDLDFGRQYLEQVRSMGVEDVLRVARTYLRPERMTLAVLVPRAAEGAVHADRLLNQARNHYAERETLRMSEAAGGGEPASPMRAFRLANGATLLVRENRAVPLVAVNAVFLGGLLSETRETNGISHYTASMLTKGTSTRSAERIAQEIEALAGSLSGFSGKNAFGLSSQVLSEHFAAAFEVFTDVLLHPSFPEDQLENTRRDILAAIKNREDNLAGVTFDLFWQSLYPCHPYGMDVLGTEESIGNMARQDLLSYYAGQAVAPNLVLSVVGDVSETDVLEKVERALEEMPQTPFHPPVNRCSENPARRAEKVVSPDKLQAHIIVGARGARYGDSDRYSLEVLKAVLSGMGGRLFTELRDQQSLAYSVTAFNQEAYDPGAVGIYMATQPANLDKALEGIHEQLQRIRERKVTREELDRAKQYLMGSYELGLQTNASQASLMALFERYGLGYASFLDYPEKIRKVTARQVKRAARKYLCPECLVEVVVVPEERTETPSEVRTDESAP